MESDFTPQKALAEAERAAVAPWIDYPPTPWWYYPAVGGWVAALLVTFGVVDDPWRLGVAALLIGLEFWFISWIKRKRGIWPQVTKPPAEFKPALRAYMAGAAVVVLAIAAAGAFVGVWLAAPLAFVLVTVGLYWYEKVYERAVDRTRRRVEPST